MHIIFLDEKLWFDLSTAVKVSTKNNNNPPYNPTYTDIFRTEKGAYIKREYEGWTGDLAGVFTQIDKGEAFKIYFESGSKMGDSGLEPLDEYQL